MFLCQSGIWPILCQLVAILAKLLDMDFKFVLPSIYNNTPKTHQSGHISKPHFAQVSFTKKPTPPTFFNEFSETFRINVNMDFAHTNHGRFFLFRPPKKIWAQNPKKEFTLLKCVSVQQCCTPLPNAAAVGNLAHAAAPTKIFTPISAWLRFFRKNPKFLKKL